MFTKPLNLAHFSMNHPVENPVDDRQQVAPSLVGARSIDTLFRSNQTCCQSATLHARFSFASDQTFCSETLVETFLQLFEIKIRRKTTRNENSVVATV